MSIHLHSKIMRFNKLINISSVIWTDNHLYKHLLSGGFNKQGLLLQYTSNQNVANDTIFNWELLVGSSLSGFSFSSHCHCRHCQSLTFPEWHAVKTQVIIGFWFTILALLSLRQGLYSAQSCRALQACGYLFTNHHLRQQVDALENALNIPLV